MTNPTWYGSRGLSATFRGDVLTLDRFRPTLAVTLARRFVVSAKWAVPLCNQRVLK